MNRCVVSGIIIYSGQNITYYLKMNVCLLQMSLLNYFRRAPLPDKQREEEQRFNQEVEFIVFLNCVCIIGNCACRGECVCN